MTTRSERIFPKLGRPVEIFVKMGGVELLDPDA